MTSITTLLGHKGDIVEFTVENSVAIPKFSLMALTSHPQTATISVGATTAQVFAGIAAIEKSATDGVTQMPCITHCVAELTTTAGGSGGFGEPVMLAGLNVVTLAVQDEIDQQGWVVGKCLETLGASATGAVHVNVGRRH